MITIEHDGKLVNVAVLGEFTLEDFTEFEEYLMTNNLLEQRADLLYDLTEMVSFTVDLALEEIKFSRIHGGDFRRIAVVTDSQWVAWSAWLEQMFFDAELNVFDDIDAARQWLTELESN